MTDQTAQVKEIHGQAKTVRMLLQHAKYSLEYYQREYKWQEKHIKELIDDLTSRFLEDFDETHERSAVQHYGHYFLGSIIISRKNGLNYLIDGQQRLTSLTLLLIFLRNTMRALKIDDGSDLAPLIYSTQFGKKSFNMQVEERTACMEALYADEEENFDSRGQSESVRNISECYEVIKASFPVELQDQSLPYFADWLTDKVHLVEILAYSDEDAYAIFETMNDRGLSLSPVEMLKGYLLSNIEDENKRDAAHAVWKKRIVELRSLGKDLDADFFKAWLRSQHANTIRERKKDAQPKDFDVIGTAFHRWVRDNHEALGLKAGQHYYAFITKTFDFYAHHYIRLVKASKTLTKGLEHIFYNAQHGFTLQPTLLLAPLRTDDSDDEVDLKLRLAAVYVDIWLNRRLWNFHSIAYSTVQYAIFLVMRDIRGLEPRSLEKALRKRLEAETETFASNPSFALHKQNHKHLHRMLARLTDFAEQMSGSASHYLEYTNEKVKEKGKKKTKDFEIEHIWANKPARHRDEFPQQQDFLDYRNRVGGLLLLPKSFNASYGDLPYDEKLPHYFGQNLLVKSLNSQCYAHNPGFLRFVRESGLPFQSYAEFKKADLDARTRLYIEIAERLWNPARITEAVNG